MLEEQEEGTSPKKSPLESLMEQAGDFLRRSEGGNRKKEPDPRQMKDLLKRYHGVLEKLMAAPFWVGTIVGSIGPIEDEKSLLILSCNGRISLVNQPPVEANELLLPGDTVKVAPESMQVLGKVDFLAVGSVSTVKEIIDHQLVEVDFNGTSKIVFTGTYSGKLKEDDRVILDQAAAIVIGYLGSGKRFRLGNKPTVTWDDIGGLEEAKRQMIETIEFPVLYGDLYQHYDKDPITGVLLLGPPGCGKTMIIEASATSLAKIHGSEAVDSGFILVKGPELLEMYVGAGEKLVRQLFAMAKEHKARHGYPAIIAIDEADAILSKRGTGKSSDMEKTMVPAFLTEMQGVDESGARIILATNRPDVLDPAVIRDGRINRNIMITRPTKESAQQIFRLNLKNVPLVGMSLDEAVQIAAEEFYSPEWKYYEIKKKGGEVLSFTLANLVNGAMLAGVVDKATSFAMDRDIAASSKTGLHREDIKKAVRQTFEQKAELNHADELQEFVRDFSEDLAFDPVQKVKQATKP